jgi:glyoxylase-like metal-dependent hydrolase (beta-lactamase superfamily II)
MRVEPIAPGLWWWASPHPEWTEDDGGPGGWDAEVASIYVEGDDGVVLIDPLVPVDPGDRERFWRALDRDLLRLSEAPLAVLVSSPWHRRSAAAVAERYRGRTGTAIRVHEEAAAFVAELDARPFREGDALPCGVRPHRIDGTEPTECAFWIPDHRALVFADAVIGTGHGALQLCPSAWLAAGEEGRERHVSQLRPSIRRLVDLGAERVLPSHGAPVLARGAEALAVACEAPPRGE